MQIGIVGMGVVGATMARRFERAELVTYDKRDGGPAPVSLLAACDVILVCVDTPSLPDGSCDTANVEDVVSWLRTDNPVVIKSTVPPGATDDLIEKYELDICHSPEYVGEGFDADHVFAGGRTLDDFTILGGDGAVRARVADVLTTCLGPHHRIFHCSAAEAEIIKYMENTYLAAKVTFVNEWREFSDAVGADWSRIREGWLLDPRVERSHTAVFPDSRGYGGRCLPKDMSAAISAHRSVGLPATFLDAIRTTNRRFGADDATPGRAVVGSGRLG